MRKLTVLLASALGLAASIGLFAPASSQTTCTGLCLQQTTCAGGGTTSISGIVYAPNGVDPLPNVLVYIPNAPVDAFTAGVSCPIVGAPPSGSPLVGAMTAVDGTFTIRNAPVGTNIPIVIQSGRWRRQLTIPTTTACADTSFPTRMPRNQSEGEIPKFAIATGSVDAVECVLLKVGVDKAEFTNAGGTGRFNLYKGSGATGAQIDASTPSQSALMSDQALLNSYDVLMLPCQGAEFRQDSKSLSNFVDFANAGGRVYSSHFSYVWMFNNPPFNGTVNWKVNQPMPKPDPGIALVDPTFGQGATLTSWLQEVGASTTPGQIAISTLRHDLNGVIPPTQSWLKLDNPGAGNPTMQFTFDTPIAASNQCGKVLFNEYHVEAASAAQTMNANFPNECSTGAMTPQEKLLEFSLFNLTNDGGAATLTPNAADFGDEPVGFTSPAKAFTWTNNSIFSSSVSSASATGPFSVTTSGCASVASGASCQILVAFAPTMLGAATGVLTVGSAGNTLTASLTGTGTPGLSLSPTSLDFGGRDVGESSTKTVTVSNNAQGTIPLPKLILTGDYTAATTCTDPVPAASSCVINITFKPTATGTRAGTLTLNSALTLMVSLTGVGQDFTLALSPTSGSVLAGLGTSTNAIVGPVSGYARDVVFSCTTNAAGSTCGASSQGVNGGASTTSAFNITTTSLYTVPGYGGAGSALLASFALLSGVLLLAFRRAGVRRGASLARLTLGLLLLASLGILTTGCTGKLPAQNPTPTLPGDYTYTISATDGIITHSATYSLHVRAK